MIDCLATRCDCACHYDWVCVAHVVPCCDRSGQLVAVCDQCGEKPSYSEGLCLDCLIEELTAEVCCPDSYTAARRYCGCGGVAATALRMLRERIDDER